MTKPHLTVVPDPTDTDVEDTDADTPPDDVPDAEPVAMPSDEEIMAFMEEQRTARQAQHQTRTVTLEELVTQIGTLTAGLLGYPRLKFKAESTALKVVELAMGWALNNRGVASEPILDAQQIGTQE